MTMWKKRAALALAALIGAFGAESAGAVLVVGPGCSFTELQAAMDVAEGNDAFIVVMDGYVGDPVSTHKTLHITGGVRSCTDFTVVGTSKLQPDIGVTGPVISLSGGARLDLRNFEITGANNDGHNGGGISFKSEGDHGHIELHNVTISSNRADKGGGIFYDGETADDTLDLDHVQIFGNVANNGGGGIRIQGNTIMTADAGTSITLNAANPDDADDGRGGGLQVLDSADATLDGGVIFGNSSRYGGGISIHDFGGVNAFGTSIVANSATHSGGGVFLEPGSDNPFFSATTSIVSQNTAANGGAVYADLGSDEFGFPGQTRVFFNRGDCHRCANEISFNTTTQQNGATIVIQNEGTLDLNQAEVRNNSSDIMLQMFDHVDFTATNDLVVDNIGRNSQSFVSVIASAGHAVGDVTYSTIADNAFSGNGSVFAGTTADFTLQGVLIWQPGTPTLGGAPGDSTTFLDVLTQDATLFDGTQFNVFSNVVALSDPRFVDAAHGDFHLTDSSPAVDFSSTETTAKDLDNNPRGKQLLRSTSFDAGAFELQQLDTVPPPPDDDHIFTDDFDGAP